MIHVRFVSVIVLLLCAPARAEGLLSVYRLAVINDPVFGAAEASYKATQQRVPQARASFLPNLSATAGLNRNSEEVVTDNPIFSRPAGQASYRSDEYKLTLTQPIYNATARATLGQANAEVRRAEAEFQLARHDLILRVVEAYLGVLLAQDALSLARAERQALARSLDTATGQKEAGLVSITEVNDARARYQVGLAQEIEAANVLDDNREALREISGRVPGILAALRDDDTFAAPDPPDITRWVDSALEHNLGVRAAREAVEVARQDIERNRSAHYPTLDAVGSHSRLDADGSIPGPGLRSTDTVIGLQLSIPIFQGGLVNARTEEAAHRYDAALQALEGRRRAIERATRTAFKGATSGAARISALRQAVVAAESALAAKAEGTALGLYTILDVLDSTRDLYRARRDYTEARHAYILNYLRLKSAAGTLGEEDVLALNRWLR